MLRRSVHCLSTRIAFHGKVPKSMLNVKFCSTVALEKVKVLQDEVQLLHKKVYYLQGKIDLDFRGDPVSFFLNSKFVNYNLTKYVARARNAVRRILG